MQADINIVHVSKVRLRTGWLLSIIAILFMLMDSIIKLLMLPAAVETTKQLGYAAHLIPVMGIIQLICVILYIAPRTSILGAVLLTGYLGGAVATNVRIEAPLFSHILFPVYIGVIIWGGLFLRDSLLASLLPIKYNP